MKYYLIVGEASGDLHASNLMRALIEQDEEAEFRYYGGDMMQQVGGTLVKHYRELAYMGFIPVLLHLRTILRNMRMCKQDLLEWNPDVIILVDYPGFNLKIAAYVKQYSRIPVFYYISPKIWAWKEHRIHQIRRNVDALFSILPFEVEFFRKHHYPISYVGNPSVDSVRAFQTAASNLYTDFRAENHLDHRPIIALLAGSRKQEIKDNLPLMLEAVRRFPQYQAVIAGAPGIDPTFYEDFITPSDHIVYNQTYALLQASAAALVTSGTATLETALFKVPQVVCYYMRFGKIVKLLKKRFLKVKYISLVNLILGKEAVRELIADDMCTTNLVTELAGVLPGGVRRAAVMTDYEQLIVQLGEAGTAKRAATQMLEWLQKK